MNVIADKKVAKDLKGLPSAVKLKVNKIHKALTLANTLEGFPGCKKLKGYSSTYRIRIGDYRIGLFYEDNVISISRVIHRKDIYKGFP